jgi:hypothetical protein
MVFWSGTPQCGGSSLLPRWDLVDEDHRDCVAFVVQMHSHLSMKMFTDEIPIQRWEHVKQTRAFLSGQHMSRGNCREALETSEDGFIYLLMRRALPLLLRK